MSVCICLGTSWNAVEFWYAVADATAVAADGDGDAVGKIYDCLILLLNNEILKF